MQRIPIVLKPRNVTGKNVKRLRHQGMTPVHLYGASISPVILQAPTRELVKTLTLAGKNKLLTVTVEGVSEEHPSFVREVQWDPVRGELLHVDFLRVDLTQKMRADVPLELKGEAPAVRAFHGILTQYLHSVEVEALPLEIPQSISVDVSPLVDLEAALRVENIVAPPGVTILDEPEGLVARVELPKVEEVAAPEEAAVEGEAAEGEAAAEGGEAAAEGAEAATDEKKEKKEG